MREELTTIGTGNALTSVAVMAVKLGCGADLANL